MLSSLLLALQSYQLSVNLWATHKKKKKEQKTPVCQVHKKTWSCHSNELEGETEHDGTTWCLSSTAPAGSSRHGLGGHRRL